jgi:hypothetical protein
MYPPGPSTAAKGIYRFSQPSILSEIGTSTDFVANPVHGWGHLLCVIPYRSLGELLTLMSNLGNDATTSIYASNCDVVKRLVLNVRVSR